MRGIYCRSFHDFLYHFMNQDRDIIHDAFRRHNQAAKALIEGSTENILMVAEMFCRAVRGGSAVFTCGNGGSAADAQHFAGELLCRYKGDRRPLPAVALTADSSTLTAISNDYEYREVFARQLEALGHAGDVLIAFTTSGRSPNVLRALEVARIKQMNTIALTGSMGRHLEGAADIVVIVPSEETARIQEIHELIYHAWCEYLDAQL